MFTSSHLGFERKQRSGRKRLGWALAAVVAGILPAGADNATPGHPSCYKLEQACLSHLAGIRSVTHMDGADVVATGDPTATMDGVCYDLFAATQQTGLWPTHKGFPPVHCSN